MGSHDDRLLAHLLSLRGQRASCSEAALSCQLTIGARTQVGSWSVRSRDGHDHGIDSRELRDGGRPTLTIDEHLVRIRRSTRMRRVPWPQGKGAASPRKTTSSRNGAALSLPPDSSPASRPAGLQRRAWPGGQLIVLNRQGPSPCRAECRYRAVPGPKFVPPSLRGISPVSFGKASYLSESLGILGSHAQEPPVAGCLPYVKLGLNSGGTQSSVHPNVVREEPVGVYR